MYINLEVKYAFGKIISYSGKKKNVWLGFDTREVTTDIVKSSFSDILNTEYRNNCVEPLRKLIQHILYTNHY